MPKTQSSVMEAVIPRIQRLTWGHRDMVNGVQLRAPLEYRPSRRDAAIAFFFWLEKVRRIKARS